MGGTLRRKWLTYCTLKSNRCGNLESHFPGTLQQVVPPHWGETGYASEELVAELGSAFLCADLELHQEPREDNAMHTLRIGWEF